jgi:hypothetical protein
VNDIGGGGSGFDWRAAVLRNAYEVMRCSRLLAGDVAGLAGEVAATEEALAVNLDRRAEACPERGQELRGAAGRARGFAEHERREQARWQGVYDSEDGVA